MRSKNSVFHIKPPEYPNMDICEGSTEHMFSLNYLTTLPADSHVKNIRY